MKGHYLLYLGEAFFIRSWLFKFLRQTLLRVTISTKNIFMNWKHRLIPFKDMWIYVVLLSARCRIGALCMSTRITVI